MHLSGSRKKTTLLVGWMNCVKINRFFRIPRVVGSGNPDYKPVEIRTSVPVKEKNLTDQVLIGESGTSKTGFQRNATQSRGRVGVP